MTAVEAKADQTEELAGALVERLFDHTIATLELSTVWLGTRLRLYDALATPGTVAEVALRSGVRERYVREWLEQQAIAGLVTVVEAHADPGIRRFGLSDAQRLVLADVSSPFSASALALLAGGFGAALPQVLDAWRAGTGVSFGAYGDDVREGQGLFNKGDYDERLVQDWLPVLPEVDALLSREGACALDLGCGVGWSTLALAGARPGLTAVGVDLDEASIMDARANAVDAGLGDRARFEVATSDTDHGTSAYDVAFFLESLHDMGRPIEALAAVRRALRPGGLVVVMDERAEEAFAPDGSPLERLLAACSVLHCLPVSLAEPGSTGTGAVFRPSILRAYAEAAGYAEVRMAPIEHDFMRFYVLVP
ncbi:class I SAM-dependent methyltransferase [Nocardioides sp. WS12]|uniref:class I SAM-dependent methyltransferase n=1 Tax=Nocardioides sp. WS12 TaxID=2486272 RepID=UPI0015FDE615|nr:class I SAM-dependent methyltransferase [Nocardioides sp. WS12]